MLRPLSVYRHEETYRAKIDDIVLQVGDVINLHGTWNRLKALHKEGGLLFSLPSDMEEMRPEKALWAGLWLIIALVMIMGFKIQLSVALMTGALGMILTRVLTIDEAYQSVDWRTIFLLAGLIPLGIATEKTGAARLDRPDDTQCHRGRFTDCSADGHRHTLDAVHPGYFQCRGNGSAGTPGGQHGHRGPYRSANGGPGGRDWPPVIHSCCQPIR